MKNTMIIMGLSIESIIRGVIANGDLWFSG